MPAAKIQQVDIAICTWNRHRLLAQTLASISRLEVPATISLRLIVIDNGSTDATAELLDQFTQSTFSRAHGFVSCLEPQQGHTFSRNRAIALTQGDLVVWTDDDVQVATDWISNYVVAADANSEFTFFGSVIEPAFSPPMPTWIEENWESLKGCFAARDLGSKPMDFSSDCLPYGANFAIRTEVQKRFLFDTELGRRGEQVVGEDELDLFRRLLASGHRGRWVPGAVVKHLIPPERATEAYVLDYFVGQGRSLAARGKAWDASEAELLREAKTSYRSYRLKRWYAPSPTWVSHLIRSGLARGQWEQRRGA